MILSGTCGYYIYLVSLFLMEAAWGHWLIAVPLMLHAAMMCGYGFLMATQQSTMILHSLTTNEQINRARYRYLYNDEGKFENPFDEGPMLNCLTFFKLRTSNVIVDPSKMRGQVVKPELAMSREGLVGQLVQNHQQQQQHSHAHSHGGQKQQHAHSHGGKECHGHSHNASSKQQELAPVKEQ